MDDIQHFQKQLSEFENQLGFFIARMQGALFTESRITVPDEREINFIQSTAIPIIQDFRVLVHNKIQELRQLIESTVRADGNKYPIDARARIGTIESSVMALFNTLADKREALANLNKQTLFRYDEKIRPFSENLNDFMTQLVRGRDFLTRALTDRINSKMQSQNAAMFAAQKSGNQNS